jgi:PAS domain S-box-containing protein
VILTVNKSVHRLVTEIEKVSQGEETLVEQVNAPDELGHLARSVDRMARSVAQRTKAQEKNYRRLVDNSTDAVIVVDSQGRMVMANPEAGRILGRKASELAGVMPQDLVVTSDWEVVRASLSQASTGGKASEIIKFRVRAFDGQVKVLEGRFRLLREGSEDQQVVLGNLRDVTEREALESALERHRLFENSLISQALNAILATDQDGVIRVFNQSAEELFGMPADQVIGRLDFSRLFARAQAGQIQKRLFDQPRPGTSFNRPAVIKTASGRRLPVRMAARSLFLEDEFSGAMFYLQNMRESKALKAQLVKKARLAAVGETTAGLAHCIKNLLHGLGSASHIVDQGMADGDQELAAQGWRMVKANLDRVETLTQDLLAYAKDRRPQYQPFNLNELLSECRSLVAGRANDAGVEINLEPGEGCERVVLDPMGIRRVLLNLVSNSLDALTTSPKTDHGRITLASHRDGFGQVVVRVEDNGPGIPPEAARYLLRGLFSTKGSKGTGLGLLVCQKIIEEHGGTLAFESPPNSGTKFVMVVPDLAESGAG